MKGIRMVPFAAAHVAALAEIEQICFTDPWTENGLREELSNPCARFFTAVTEDGCAAGYIGCHVVLDEGYITNVAVLPAFRHRGIARQLVKTLLARSRELSFVTLEVRVSNAPAIALYTSCGFVLVGTRKGFYHHPTEDAQLMSCFLQKKEREENDI